MHHYITAEQESPYKKPVTYYFGACYTNQSLRGFLAMREIIANAFSIVRISPRTNCKDSIYFFNNKTISCFSIKKAQDCSRARLSNGDLID